MIRPATVKDVPAIARHINYFAERGRMLFRSHAELYEVVRDFIVYEADTVTPATVTPASCRPSGQSPEGSTQPTPQPPGPPHHAFSSEPQILGVCALEIVWADLAEVRSLAVDPAHQGKGIGRALVAAVASEATRLHIQRIFALTYEQTFFEKSGFRVVDKSALPLKVWSDCVKCPKRDGCDEIAVVKTLLEKPAVQEPDPNTLPGQHYEVPTPLIQLRTPQNHER